jgi:hypothetical protein
VFIKEARRSIGERLIVITEPPMVVKERQMTVRSQGNDFPRGQLTITASPMTITEGVLMIAEPMLMVARSLHARSGASELVSARVVITKEARRSIGERLIVITEPLMVARERQMTTRGQGNDFPRQQTTLTARVMTIAAPVATITESPLTILWLRIVITRHLMKCRDSVTAFAWSVIAVEGFLIVIGETPIAITEPRTSIASAGW